MTVIDRDESRRRVIDVLAEARSFVSRPANDFTWSSWEDTSDALAEIDDLLERLQDGFVAYNEIAVLFAPTGPLQELSLSSGWSERFLSLADRFDAAADGLWPEGMRDVVAEARFHCGLCGLEAGVLWLHGSPLAGQLRRESFTGLLTQDVSGDAFVRMREALSAGGASALFELDPEFAPFYCASCPASYCKDHWRRQDVFDEDMPGWHDSIRGTCPRGHERMLED